MEAATYNIKVNNINSDMYYKKISAVSKRVKKVILDKGNKYLSDFMEYVEKNKIEELRTKDEYAIEFLMIGVMLNEYSYYGHTLTKKTYVLFSFLNKLRKKNSYKNKIDNIRGYLISRILYKRSYKKYDINDLVIWMAATGDFKEEVYRLKVWISFLENRDKEYHNNFIKETISTAQIMENICEETLEIYIKPLEKFLKNAPQRYKNREDLIYCSKGKMQYYFNSICAEIMNEVYKEKFAMCKNKKIFAPACMRQVKKKCSAVKSDFGYVCRQCNSSCNINSLNKLVEKRNIEVCIIPHETIIDTLHIEDKNKIGIIGIACITNLMSGGWKALRLGFIPQCVILDYCGCNKHWLDQGEMTSINNSYLLNLI